MQNLSLIYKPSVFWVLFAPESSSLLSEPRNVFFSPVSPPLELFRVAFLPSLKTWDKYRDFFQNFCLLPSLWAVVKSLECLEVFLWCIFSIPISRRLKSGVPKIVVVSALLLAFSLRAWDAFFGFLLAPLLYSCLMRREVVLLCVGGGPSCVIVGFSRLSFAPSSWHTLLNALWGSVGLGGLVFAL